MTESASTWALVVYSRRVYSAARAQKWTASGPTGTRGTGKPARADVTSSFEVMRPELLSRRGGTSNIEHPTFNIQHPTSNIQHPTSNIQHPTSNIQARTSKGRALGNHSMLGVRGWMLDVHWVRRGCHCLLSPRIGAGSRRACQSTC